MIGKLFFWFFGLCIGIVASPFFWVYLVPKL